MSEETKKCPFCAERIQAAAVACRFCGQDLTTPAVVTPAVPQPKRRPPLIYFIMLTVLICGVPAWLIWPRDLGKYSPAPASSNYQITYRLIGTAKSASLTYQNATGGTEQRDVTIPWSMSFGAYEGQIVSFSAQNKGESGTLTCEILLNGARVKASTSGGTVKVASCSAKI